MLPTDRKNPLTRRRCTQFAAESILEVAVTSMPAHTICRITGPTLTAYDTPRQAGCREPAYTRPICDTPPHVPLPTRRHSSAPRLLATANNPSHASRISARAHVSSTYRQLMNAQLAGWLTAIVPNRTRSAAVQGLVPTP